MSTRGLFPDVFFRSLNKLKQIPLMKKTFGQNLSQIGAPYDLYGQKNLGRQLSGIELRVVTVSIWMSVQPSTIIQRYSRNQAKLT